MKNWFIKLLTTLLILLTITPYINIDAKAADKTYGDYKYSINGTTVTITNYVGKKSKIKIPASIGGKSVTTIGPGAFADKQLTSVVIPNSVIVIEGSAFSANKLKKITIPSSVKEISEGAFWDNTTLKNVTIPKSVTKIGNDVFYKTNKNLKISGYANTTAQKYAKKNKHKFIVPSSTK